MVVSNSFFLGTSTRLISAGSSDSEGTGRIWGLTMNGNSLNHIELIGNWNATDARASISDSNIPTSGLGFSPSRRRGSQMTTVHRSISTPTLSGGLQQFFFNFSDPGESNSQDTLLLPEISFLQYSVVFLSGQEQVPHSMHSPGDSTGTAVSVMFDREVKAIVHVEARCCTGMKTDDTAKRPAGNKFLISKE